MKKLVYVFALLLFACEDQSDPQATTQHSLTFGFDIAENSNARHSAVPKCEPEAIIISIKDSQGEQIYAMEEINLVRIGDEYVTQAIELSPGTYTIEDFIVVDSVDVALYLTPKEKSDLAELVSTPLPHVFTVASAKTNNVVLDVIDADLGKAAAFGYATFSFQVVNTLDLGLVAHLPFDSNAEDVSGYNNHGRVSGASLAPDRLNNPNNAYYFDGVNDYVEVSDDSSLYFSNEFSLSAWINLQSGKEWGSRIIDKSVGSQGTGWVLDTYNADKTGRKIRLQTVNSWKYASDELLALNQWYHVVTTFKDGIGRIYINGELSSENAGEEKTIVNDNTPLRIGFDTGVRVSTDFDDGFHGSIDEVRIYNRTLTSEEVSKLYKQ